MERCKVLLHLVDLTEEDLLENYLKIRNELSEYNDILVKKKEIVFFNKADLVEKKEIVKKIKKFKDKFKGKFDAISTFSKKDITNVKKILIKNATK